MKKGHHKDTKHKKGAEDLMKYITSLLIKFVIMTAILWVILGGVFGVSFADIIITSIVLTGLSFIIGDLYFLPMIGNVGAAMIDFILALAGVWALGSFLYEEPISLGTASLTAAVGVAVGELLVHWYMKTKVTPADVRGNPGYYERDLQTEFSSEIEPDSKQEEKKNPQE